MEKITMEELMSEVDISRWSWSWLGDLFQQRCMEPRRDDYPSVYCRLVVLERTFVLFGEIVEDLGNGHFVVKFDAKDIIIDEPSFFIEDADLGIITDAEGRTFQVTDWNDEHFVYCEVEKTDDGIIPVDTQFSF